MRIFVFSNDEHEPLVEHLCSAVSSQDTLVVRHIEPDGKAQWGDAAFKQLQVAKFRGWAEVMRENEGQLVALVDADVQLFGPISIDLGTYDLAAQRSVRRGDACPGFVVVRCSEEVACCADEVAALCEKNRQPASAPIFNMIFGSRLRMQLLGSEYCGERPGKSRYLVMHHACYVRGTQEKLAELRRVRQNPK